MKSRRMRWAGHITCMGGMRNACKIFVGKLKWKRPLTRPRHRWDDDIKVDRREIDRERVSWIHLAHYRDQWRDLINTVLNLRVP